MNTTNEFLDAVRRTLLEERRTLITGSVESAQTRKPVELDQQSVGRLSRMDALQVQAMALETERRRQLRLRRIEVTLQRIDDGEFGFCVECGEKIQPKRIALDPTIPNCVKCASKGG